MDLDQQLHRDEERGGAEPATGVPAGKSTLTARLGARSPSLVLRVADEHVARALGEAIRGTDARIQREVEPGAARDANGVAAGAEEAVARAAGGSGEPLRDDLRARFEASLGTDLSGVRVHLGAASAEANKAVGAKAYTVGNDIHFGAGHYQPDDPFGMHLLAHEVAHTVQQAGGGGQRQHKLEVSTPGDASEVEADRAADAMVRGARAALGTGGALLARDAALTDGAGGDAVPADTAKVDRNATWTAPTADSVPHESVDPRVLTEKPTSPKKVWNPPPPVGWQYWPKNKKVTPPGQQLAEAAKKKPMGTFTQDIVDGQLIAARTEWHDATVKFDADKKPYTIPGVFHSGSLMLPLEQPEELPKKVQRAADPSVARRQHKLEVSTPGDASEAEADRAADAMVRGARAAIGAGAAQVARDHDGHGDPDAGPAEKPRTGTGTVKADGTDVVDRVGQRSKVIETLAKDAVVTLTHDADSHFKIKTPTGTVGYVPRGALDLEKKPEPDQPPSDTPSPEKAAPAKVGKNDPWTAPTADHVPHESVDPRVLTEKPTAPAKVWNPPPPVGWRYWPANKKIPPRGKQMTDEATHKPMGTFVQDVVDGQLIAARTEWHNATVKFDADKKPYTEPGVFHAGNLMLPLEQPKELPKQVQRAADPRLARRQYKLEVSTPADAAELEADRAADAMVRGARTAIGNAMAVVARDFDGHGDPDAGPAEQPRSGSGYVKADGTEVVDRVGQRSKVIETLAKDAVVTLTHDAGSHFKVKTGAGTIGYVAKGKLDLEKPAPAPAEKDQDKPDQQKPSSTLKRPHGLAEIIEVFGKPGTDLGMHELQCGKHGKKMQVYCHNKIAPLFKAVFDAIVADGKAEHLHYFDGCYNDRPKAGGQGKSVHAWGIACDINPEGNGRVASDTPADKIPVSESQKIIAPYFEAQGFVWGRAFGDSMHFQYCTGY